MSGEVKRFDVSSAEIVVGSWICDTTGEQFMRYVLRRRAEGKAELLGTHRGSYVARAVHEGSSYWIALTRPRERHSILTVQAEASGNEEGVRYIGEDLLAVTGSRVVEDQELAEVANKVNAFAARMMNRNPDYPILN